MHDAQWLKKARAGGRLAGLTGVGCGRKAVAALALIATGNDEIDSGHLALVRRLGELEWAIASRCSTEVVGLYLADFGELALRHFAQEEQILAEIGYPRLQEHRDEHQALIQELERYGEAFARDGRPSVVEALAFLERWTLDHLKNEDADYLPYLAAANGRPPLT